MNTYEAVKRRCLVSRDDAIHVEITEWNNGEGIDYDFSETWLDSKGSGQIEWCAAVELAYLIIAMKRDIPPEHVKKLLDGQCT